MPGNATPPTTPSRGRKTTVADIPWIAAFIGVCVFVIIALATGVKL